MTDIPRDHPRYESLMTRHLVEEGVKDGLVASAGLIAHGRGEAFDYLIGEATAPFGKAAVDGAAAHLVLAQRPVLSINGNTAVLVPDGIAALQKALTCRVEVNLFYRTEARVAGLTAHLEKHGVTDVLGTGAEPTIPGLSSERARSTPDGVAGADVVLVPLEDGDRCEALVAMGKTVIVVDLNPLSRTAQRAHVTIVDNVRRAMPALAARVTALRASDSDVARTIVARYDNAATLAEARAAIAARLSV